MLTLGAAGAEVHGADGSRNALPAVSGGPVVDTVGAGDAFSAVVLLGLARRWPWPLILQRAQELAGAVVGLRGATSTDPDFYKTFAADWEQT